MAFGVWGHWHDSIQPSCLAVSGCTVTIPPQEPLRSHSQQTGNGIEFKILDAKRLEWLLFLIRHGQINATAKCSPSKLRPAPSGPPDIFKEAVCKLARSQPDRAISQ